MLFLISIAIDMLSVGAVAVPVLFAVQAVLYPSRPFLHRLALIAFSLCAIAIFSVTGMPTVLHHTVDFSFSFVPLAGFFDSPVQYILNVALFVPVGFFAPLLWQYFHSLHATALLGFCFSLFIELAQIFTFRVTDVNDLLTNTLGAIVGFSLAKVVFPFDKRTVPCALNGKHAKATREPGPKEATLVLTLVFLLQFFLQPIISEPLWNLIL